MTAPRHVPVLLAEVLAALGPVAGARVIDGTFGAGGYSRAFLEAGANVIAFDRDPRAVRDGAALVAESGGRLDLVEAPFSALADRVTGPVDAVVFDLGVSSMQLDEADRGFSFRADGPLDMRMGGDGPSAADLVRTLDQDRLADILFHYGEERRSRAIARAIVARRTATPFERTKALADLVESVIGRHPADPSHPATRTFQALRIAVNRELDEVADGLCAAERVLKPGGRLVVVTFHSLEDRIVKRFFQERARPSAPSRHVPDAATVRPTFELTQRKPVEPSPAEVARNPRSRSAKLRSGVRTAAPAHPLDRAALGVPLAIPTGARR